MSGGSTLGVRSAGLLGAEIKKWKLQNYKNNDCNIILIRTFHWYKCIVEIYKLSMQDFLHVKILEGCI